MAKNILLIVQNVKKQQKLRIFKILYKKTDQIKIRNLQILKINILLRINYNFPTAYQLKTLHHLKLPIVKLYRKIANQVILGHILILFQLTLRKAFRKMIVKKVKKNNKVINKKRGIFIIIMMKVQLIKVFP